MVSFTRATNTLEKTANPLSQLGLKEYFILFHIINAACPISPGQQDPRISLICGKAEKLVKIFLQFFPQKDQQFQNKTSISELIKTLQKIH